MVTSRRKWKATEETDIKELAKKTSHVGFQVGTLSRGLKNIEKYIRAFPERIKGNITSSKPATLHEAINMARELVEQSVQALAGGKIYAGNLPKCNRCNLHQNVTCFGCGERGHFKDKYPKAGNQQNDGAHGRAYVVIENLQQNLNVVR
ncbi:hypothetical protein Tco_0919982, partial [Tanacetum coccineum]